MQDVRDALRRRQRLEHDEQREPDRIGEHDLVLGIEPVRAVDDRLRQMPSSGSSPCERRVRSIVQRDAADDRHEPGLEVLDLVVAGAAEP